jgi:hypothetical protein
MMTIDRFLSDEQDPKAVEKVLGKLNDMLTANEELIYLAVQKRPAVNLLPDCIVVSNKRIFYCEPANFGMTMNFKDISWKSIKEVSFKEEIFSSKFICVPQHGENIITEYIPKVQARKLYQAAYELLEKYKEEQQQAEAEERRAVNISTNGSSGFANSQGVNSQPINSQAATGGSTNEPAPAAPDHVNPLSIATTAANPPEDSYIKPYVAPVDEPEDEMTLKLRKLKNLFDKQLITQEEYEAKKANILDSF